MRTPRSVHRAIFVLESPWGLDEGDANRSSIPAKTGVIEPDQALPAEVHARSHSGIFSLG
jgi:hypothetical protein